MQEWIICVCLAAKRMFLWSLTTGLPSSLFLHFLLGMASFLGTSVGRWCYTCLGRNNKRCWPPGLIKHGNTWALFKEPLIWASKSPSASHGLSNNSKSSVTVRMRCCIWKLHRLYGIMSLEISLRWFGVPPRWKADTYLPVFNIEISRKCHLNKGVLLKLLKPLT